MKHWVTISFDSVSPLSSSALAMNHKELTLPLIWTAVEMFSFLDYPEGQFYPQVRTGKIDSGPNNDWLQVAYSLQCAFIFANGYLKKKKSREQEYWWPVNIIWNSDFYKVLLAHSHTHSFTYCVWLLLRIKVAWDGSNRNPVAHKAKNTIWPLTERVCQALFKVTGVQSSLL